MADKVIDGKCTTDNLGCDDKLASSVTAEVKLSSATANQESPLPFRKKDEKSPKATREKDEKSPIATREKAKPTEGKNIDNDENTNEVKIVELPPREKAAADVSTVENIVEPSVTQKLSDDVVCVDDDGGKMTVTEEANVTGTERDANLTHNAEELTADDIAHRSGTNNNNIAEKQQQQLAPAEKPNSQRIKRNRSVRPNASADLNMQWYVYIVLLFFFGGGGGCDISIKNKKVGRSDIF